MLPMGAEGERYSYENKPETPPYHEETTNLFDCCSSMNKGIKEGYWCVSMLTPTCCPTRCAAFASEGIALIASSFLCLFFIGFYRIYEEQFQPEMNRLQFLLLLEGGHQASHRLDTRKCKWMGQKHICDPGSTHSDQCQATRRTAWQTMMPFWPSVIINHSLVITFFKEKKLKYNQVKTAGNMWDRYFHKMRYSVPVLWGLHACQQSKGEQAKCAPSRKSSMPPNKQMILASIQPADEEQMKWDFKRGIFQCASNQKKIEIQQLEFSTGGS